MTTQQRRFVDEYLVDLDGKKAAIRAGYSVATASVCSSKLLDKPHIRAEIHRRRKPLEDKQIMTALEVLQELSGIARSKAAKDCDRIQALKPIGTYYGSFVKRVETAKPGEFADLTDEELNREIAQLAAERQASRATNGQEMLPCRN